MDGSSSSGIASEFIVAVAKYTPAVLIALYEIICSLSPAILYIAWALSLESL